MWVNLNVDRGADFVLQLVALEPPSSTPGNYWVRALPNQDSLNTYAGGLNMAILRYEGAPPVDPAGAMPPPPLKQTLKETDLHPYQNPAAVRLLWSTHRALTKCNFRSPDPPP